ncbi:thioredoxin family protein [Pseudogracilibacillus sp. SO30301A]|uniref:thioredoxin family protein n=1 Tax=Pseudogracilibacillus sp. SO30301A TaxID=3098291 RepID=UPI00300DC985
MKNKMFIIVGVIILLFVALFFVNKYKNNQALENTDNPYGKDTLKQETIDQLDDPLYQNIIVPEDLDNKLENGEDITVYYYSPTCVYCQQTTPIVVPIAEEMGVDLKKMNLHEFDLMDHYGIEGTPTIIHYENGKEVGRIVGSQENPEETFRAFFEEYVVN